jgi:N-acyl-D-amino-acid deacylase
MPSSDNHDLIFRNATVIDGTGASRRNADVAVTGDRITAIGGLGDATAKTEIDASGKVLAPGFIDAHTHDDAVLLVQPDMTPKVSQGVTTVVAGNCGVSLAPLEIRRPVPPPLDLIGGTESYKYPSFAAYLDQLDATPPSVNAIFLVGHSTLREGAMDSLDRPASEKEIGKMREVLSEALDAGAIGMSTGLFYPPARHAPTEEIIELAKGLKPAKALYATHMRDEADHLEKSVEETIRIGREADVQVIISHHKATGVGNWGKIMRTLPMIEKARERQRIAMDVYPYIASSTILQESSIGVSKRVIVTWSESMPEMAGRDLSDIAAEMGCSDLEAAEKLKPAGAVYFSMNEDDVQMVLKHPLSVVGSDGLPHDTKPHPRLWGTFPRVLGHYSRDLGLFTLEEAIHKMTGKTAEEFGITGRGVIAEGNYADLTLFDPEEIIDSADFDNPTQASAGIDTVVVNGRIVWRGNRHTNERPGRALRRQDLQAAAA